MVKEIIAINKPSGVLSSAVVDFVKLSLSYNRQQSEGQTGRKRKAQLDKPLVSDIIILSTTGRTDNHQRKRFHWPYKDIKVGHGGTLDPLASGVMVIGINKGTKQLQTFLTSCTKTYLAGFKLGSCTDTQDVTGVSISECKHEHTPITRQMIDDMLMSKFTGTINQVPPSYSAVRVGGQRLHTLAREFEKNGQAVPEAKSRQVEIMQLDLVDFGEQDGSLRIKCSSGTYVRTLVQDIFAELGCMAHMTSLVREQQGEFKLEDAMSLEELDQVL